MTPRWEVAIWTVILSLNHNGLLQLARRFSENEERRVRSLLLSELSDPDFRFSRREWQTIERWCVS